MVESVVLWDSGKTPTGVTSSSGGLAPLKPIPLLGLMTLPAAACGMWLTKDRPPRWEGLLPWGQGLSARSRPLQLPGQRLPAPRCTRGLPGASCTPAQRGQNLWDRGLGVSIALGSRRARPMRSGALQFCSAIGLSRARRGSSEGLSHLPKVTQLNVMGSESPFVSLLGRTPCPP